MFLSLNEGPVGGPCWMEPRTGTTSVTEFNINCNPFVDVDLPITYRVYDTVLKGTTCPQRQEQYTLKPGRSYRKLCTQNNYSIN